MRWRKFRASNARPSKARSTSSPSSPPTKKSSLEISTILLEKALIATTPGVAFGAAGEGHVRFSIATHMHDLEHTVDRLAELVPTL